MSMSTNSALETVIRASLDRELGGRAVGWAFQMSWRGERIVNIFNGWARAPWESDPALPMDADVRIHMASTSKFLTRLAIAGLLEDWKVVTQDLRKERIGTIEGGIITDDKIGVISKRHRVQPRVVKKIDDTLPIAPALAFDMDSKVVTLLKPPLGVLLNETSALGRDVSDITLRQLVENESGLSNADVTEIGGEPEDVHWPEQWIPALLACDVTSDSGYDVNSQLLALIIEGLTGTSFHQYLHTRILRRDVPTRFSPDSRDDYPERRARSYSAPFVAPDRDAGYGLRSSDDKLDSHYAWSMGAGGYWGSVNHINSLLQSLMWPDESGAPQSALPPAVRAKLVRGPMFGQPVGNEWQMVFGNKAYEKNGGAAGWNSSVVVIPDIRVSAVFAANTTNIDATAVMRRALNSANVSVIVPRRNQPGQFTCCNPTGVGMLKVTVDGTDPVDSVSAKQYDQFTPENRTLAGQNTKVCAAIVLTDGHFMHKNSASADYIGGYRQEDVVNVPLVPGLRCFFASAANWSAFGYNVTAPLPVPDEWTWGSVDDVSATPAIVNGQQTNYILVFAGYVEVPSNGTYQFKLKSDDGSRMWIGAGANRELLIDNDGLHSITEKDASIQLATGKHAIVVEYFQGSNQAVCVLSWNGPVPLKDKFRRVPFRSSKIPGEDRSWGRPIDSSELDWSRLPH